MSACLKEGIRNGPKWSKTLMLVMYDDWGGTYDHVVPPSEGVPADEAPCNVPKAPGSDVGCSGFDFRRLGLRSTAMVISPWVKKGAIVQEPQQGPTNTSQWEHSTASVRATATLMHNTQTHHEKFG
jgi:phospholipase C